MQPQQLIEKANSVFLENFKPETWFERAIFFSWYCSIRDCKFCYMSTQENADKKAVRSLASLLAEVILCKNLGWRFGFFSGGNKAFTTPRFKEILKAVNLALGEKLWINVGALTKEELKGFLPYIKGVVASVETVNPKIHEFVCPSKPIKPFEQMFIEADKLKLKKAITIILGLGETIKDYELLKSFIKKYKISKIHFYSLNPQKGTIFEKNKPVTKEYQAEHIARTRIDFPKIDIQAGIWLDKVNNISLLLKAGANSISKFPATRYFNSKQAMQIEQEARKAGRVFKGSLIELPDIDWDKEVNNLPFDSELKEAVRLKLGNYLKRMRNPTKK